LTSLLRVEVRRLLSRRLFRVLTLLALAGIAAGGVGSFIASDNSPEAIRRVDEERRLQVDACLQSFEEAPPGAEFRPPGGQTPEEFCEEQVFVSDPRFNYRDITELVTGLAFAFIMLGWLMGASFIGAEWHSRTITTTLTWEPRRALVLAAKCAAVVLVLFLWTALMQVVFSGAMYPAAALHGTTAGVDRELWWELLRTIARVSAGGVLAGAMGFSLATVGRNTAAALGVGFVYLAIVETTIRAFKPQWTSWLIGPNLGAFLAGGDGADSFTGHSQGEAAILLVGYAAILFAAAVFSFKRREIA
jgi:hypothetical protein